MESKKDIRKCVLAKRSSMEEKEWEEKSHRIFEKVVSHPFFLKASEIYCYVDYRREAGTREIIMASWNAGKKVAVPKIENGEMKFYYISDFEALKEGYFGILEPQTGRRAEGENALVILPGAVFDWKRNRIGYGKGFYDRYLSMHKNYDTLAIAFAFQVASVIPADAHDIRPKVLITEETIYEECITE